MQGTKTKNNSLCFLYLDIYRNVLLTGYVLSCYSFDFICCGIVSEQHRQSVMRGEEHDATEPFSWFDLSLPGQGIFS